MYCVSMVTGEGSSLRGRSVAGCYSDYVANVGVERDADLCDGVHRHSFVSPNFC